MFASFWFFAIVISLKVNHPPKIYQQNFMVPHSQVKVLHPPQKSEYLLFGMVEATGLKKLCQGHLQ
jgi:hypothetical protein